MLKVVGASWDQIRLSWWLLAGVAMLGLVAVYCGGRPRVAADGNYAATVSWNPGSGFRCEYFGQNNIPSTIKKGVARAYYQSQMIDSGFAVLEIETQKEYPDFAQAYAAGYLEGSLTWQMIYWHWQNTVQKTCVDREEYCETIKKALAENTEFMRQKASRYHKTDPYWHQIKLFYDQLDGLMFGWMAGKTRSRNKQAEDLTLMDFLWINIASDLRDLEKKFNSSRDFNPSKPSLALAFVKLLPNDFSKFVLGHASAGSYSGMLRVQKKYTFGYHRTGSMGSNLACGQTLLFTSYPGSVHSQDDLYMVASDRGETSFIVGTAIQNYNTSLWQKTDLSTQILVGPRILAANRLAVDGESWSKIAARENSGSGNKQWIYLKPEEDMVQIWVTEMLPGITVSKEMTQLVRERGFWISSNRPHFQEIISASGMPDISEDSATYNGHNESTSITSRMHHNPAVNTLIQGQANVSDLTSLMALMKSPDLSIVGRSDLFGVRDSLVFYSLLNTLEAVQDDFKTTQSVESNAKNKPEESSGGDAAQLLNQNTNQEKFTSGWLDLNSRQNKRKNPDQNQLDSDLTNLDTEDNNSDSELKKSSTETSGLDRAVNNQDATQDRVNLRAQNLNSVKVRAELDLKYQSVGHDQPASNSTNVDTTDDSKSVNISSERKKSGLMAKINNLAKSELEAESLKLNKNQSNLEPGVKGSVVMGSGSDLEEGKMGQSLLELKSKIKQKNMRSNEVLEDKAFLNGESENSEDREGSARHVNEHQLPKAEEALLDENSASSKDQEGSERQTVEHNISKKEAAANLESERTILISSSADYSTSSENLRGADGDANEEEEEEEVIRISNDDDDDDDVDDNARRYQSDKTDISIQVPGRFLFVAGGITTHSDNTHNQLNVDYSGIIDMKVISSEFDLRVAVGPPFSSSEPGKVVEPFQWSKSFIKNSPHLGHVDTWNYDFIQPHWAWPLNLTHISVS